MKNTNKYPTEWILTDDDCYQYCRQISENEFELIELCELRDKLYIVVKKIIDITDFIGPGLIEDYYYENACDALEQYGYHTNESYETEEEHLNLILKELKGIYGNQYKQIVAECMFETFYCVEGKRFISKKAAIKYIKSIVE